MIVIIIILFPSTLIQKNTKIISTSESWTHLHLSFYMEMKRNSQPTRKKCYKLAELAIFLGCNEYTKPTTSSQEPN